MDKAFGDFRRLFDEMFAAVKDKESLSRPQKVEQCIFGIDKLRSEPNCRSYGTDDLLLISYG